MSIKAGLGVSDKPDAEEAGIEACRQALDDVSSPDLLLVFSSVNYDQRKLISGVRQVGGKTPLIGCSDAGEITSFGSIKGYVAIMAIAADNINFTVGFGGNIRESSRRAGKKLAQNIKKANKDITSLILFSDILRGDGAYVLEGVKSVLGDEFLTVGGAAGDDFLLKETYVYLNDDVYPSSVVGVGLSGDYTMGVGIRHGWTPIGLPIKVTKSHGAIVEELDGKSAIEFYEEHFDMKAEDLLGDKFSQLAITYPLGMHIPPNNEFLIREPIDINYRGAIRFTAEIPQDSEVRLMLGFREEIIKAAEYAARSALSQLNNKEPGAVIVFSSTARDKLLGQHLNDELKIIQSVIGDQVPLIGCYAYGEYAPMIGVSGRRSTFFHNGAIAVILLG